MVVMASQARHGFRAASIARALLAILVMGLASCTSLQMTDPLAVSVAGIEPSPGQGLELRMLVKLRIQNPNDVAIAYDGVYVRMDVQGKTFATGVSDQAGTVPRFGEVVVSVPVSASAMQLTRQALGLVTGEVPDKIRYELSGKLEGSAFNAVHFNAEGELELPMAGGTGGRPAR